MPFLPSKCISISYRLHIPLCRARTLSCRVLCLPIDYTFMGTDHDYPSHSSRCLTIYDLHTRFCPLSPGAPKLPEHQCRASAEGAVNHRTGENGCVDSCWLLRVLLPVFALWRSDDDLGQRYALDQGCQTHFHRAPHQSRGCL